jgi:vacuolar-type H+-ATPase subunit I/STV1
MILHRQTTVDAVTGFLHNPSILLVLGVITMAAGLAMILAHNIWRGGALVVIVTLVGWLVLIKALFFLFLPQGTDAEFILKVLEDPKLFYVCMIPSLVLGIYLTYCGFSSKFRSR